MKVTSTYEGRREGGMKKEREKKSGKGQERKQERDGVRARKTE